MIQVLFCKDSQWIICTSLRLAASGLTSAGTAFADLSSAYAEVTANPSSPDKINALIIGCENERRFSVRAPGLCNPSIDQPRSAFRWYQPGARLLIQTSKLRGDRAVCVLLGFPHPYIRIGVKITRLEILKRLWSDWHKISFTAAALPAFQDRKQLKARYF